MPRLSRSSFIRRVLPGGCAFAFLGPLPALSQGVRLDVIYVPTPYDVVERMLTMADLQKGQFLIDLGSGDGRIPIMAAKKFGARGFGVDINPERVKEANANAEREGVAGQVEFRVQNLYETDFSKADVLSMYLLQEINDKLRPRILETMRPGTRVVSHAFDMGPWKADLEDRIGARRMMMWVLPAKVGGKWRVETGELSFDLDIEQQYQEIAGKAQVGGQAVALRDAKLTGESISFGIDVAGKRREFTGVVKDSAIVGQGGWKAVRRS